MATNIFGNTQSTVSPFGIGSKPVSPLGIGQTKAPVQTLSGQTVQGTSVNPGLLSQLSSLGQKAKAPEQNIASASNKLPSSQVSTQPIKPIPQATAAQGNQSIQGNTVIPQAPAGTPAPTPGPGAVPANNTGLYGQLIGQLGGFNPFSNPMVSQAYQKAQDINAQIAESKKNEAGDVATLYQQRIPMGDEQGQAQVLQNQYLQQQNALASQEAAQASIYGAGFTGTGQQASAIGTAAGLAQPQLSQFGQGYYNPLDPTGGAASAGGGALNPINNVQSIAQQVISGHISPQQAFSMGGTIANWQSLLNSAIQQANPAFNSASAQGQFDARQSNTTTAGTAATNAYASAYGQNYPASLQLQGQLQNVEGLGSLLLTTAQGGQVNPFAPQFANQTLAQFRSQLSSPDQAKFNSTLAAFQGAASSLLSSGSGQIPTDVSNNINAITNGSLSLGALQAMVNQAKQEGNIKLQTAQSLVNTPGSHIGAPQVGGNSNPLGI